MIFLYRIMRETGANLGIPVYVFGPETHMTAVVGMALGKRAIPKDPVVEFSTANFLLPGGQSDEVNSSQLHSISFNFIQIHWNSPQFPPISFKFTSISLNLIQFHPISFNLIQIQIDFIQFNSNLPQFHSNLPQFHSNSPQFHSISPKFASIWFKFTSNSFNLIQIHLKFTQIHPNSPRFHSISFKFTQIHSLSFNFIQIQSIPSDQLHELTLFSTGIHPSNTIIKFNRFEIDFRVDHTLIIFMSYLYHDWTAIKE